MTTAVVLTVAMIVTMIYIAVTAPEEGYVTRKDFEPAHTSWSMQCSGYRSNGTCRGYVMVSRYHGDTWRFKLRAKDGDKTGWREVSESKYDRYELGEWYP